MIFVRLIRTSVRRFCLCQKGASAVEFAMIAAPMLALIFGTFQHLFMSIARVSLDYALQTIAYDAENTKADDLEMHFDRTSLCNKRAVFLVDCHNEAELCFAVIPIEPALGPLDSISDCRAYSDQPFKISCCYQIIVEYAVPPAFNLVSQILPAQIEMQRTFMIRSVALIYRA